MTRRASCLDGQPRYAGLDGFRRGLTETVDWFSAPANLAATDRISTTCERRSRPIWAWRARSSMPFGTVVGPGPLALHEPRFAGNEWIYLKECLDSTFVSSVGKFVDRFEADLAAYTGAKYAVAVVNGTAALHVALHLAGVRPRRRSSDSRSHLRRHGQRCQLLRSRAASSSTARSARWAGPARAARVSVKPPPRCAAANA